MRSNLIRQRLLAAIGTGGFAAAVACSGGASTQATSVDGSPADSGATDGEWGSTSDRAFTESSAGDASGAGGGSEGSAEASAGDASDAAASLDAADAMGARDAEGGLPCVRRPFLVGGALRVAEAMARDDWGQAIGDVQRPLDARTAAALFQAWRDAAVQEHASIAAFARFTMLLLSVGAPPDLVVASQQASLDEVAHARACFALARRYGGGREVGPAALLVADALGLISLAELAALSAEEGCVGETLGALFAAEQLEHARDPEVTKMLKRVVADETRHAELAWRFVAWAIAQGGEPVRRAVTIAAGRAVAEARRVAVRIDDVDVDAWRVHGRLTSADARAASKRGIAEVIEPCLAALLAQGNARGRRAAART